MPQFTDEQYWTAEQKQKIYQNFLVCLKNRSLEKMTEMAYKYYTVDADFIAHFDRNGFKRFYSGSNFLGFVGYFLHMGSWYGPMPNELTQALHEAAKGQYADIKADIERMEYNARVEQLQSLAASLGCRVVQGQDDSRDAVLYKVNDNGQLAFI